MPFIHQKMTNIVRLHVIKLIYRSALFLCAGVLYLYHRIQNTDELFAGAESIPGLLWFIWGIYVLEMIFRFFPSTMESMGCQKQFAKNFRPAVPASTLVRPDTWRSTFAVVAAWVALNGLIGLLYMLHVIDAGILLLISLAYAVCDMICILFFCPFQTWFMKNKCCTSCRIYNWDYAMMFTPLLFVPSVYTTSLVVLSLALLAKWEILVRRHPERFFEQSNQTLACVNCKEKLCRHKRQLRNFLAHNRFRHK